ITRRAGGPAVQGRSPAVRSRICTCDLNAELTGQSNSLISRTAIGHDDLRRSQGGVANGLANGRAKIAGFVKGGNDDAQSHRAPSAPPPYFTASDAGLAEQLDACATYWI